MKVFERVPEGLGPKGSSNSSRYLIDFFSIKIVIHRGHKQLILIQVSA